MFQVEILRNTPGKETLVLATTGETGYHQCWAIAQFGQLEPADLVPITRNQTGTWPELEMKPGYKIEFGSGTGTGTWTWFQNWSHNLNFWQKLIGEKMDWNCPGFNQ